MLFGTASSIPRPASSARQERLAASRSNTRARALPFCGNVGIVRCEAPRLSSLRCWPQRPYQELHYEVREDRHYIVQGYTFWRIKDFRRVSPRARPWINVEASDGNWLPPSGVVRLLEEGRTPIDLARIDQWARFARVGAEVSFLGDNDVDAHRTAAREPQVKNEILLYWTDDSSPQIVDLVTGKANEDDAEFATCAGMDLVTAITGAVPANRERLLGCAEHDWPFSGLLALRGLVVSADVARLQAIAETKYVSGYACACALFLIREFDPVLARQVARAFSSRVIDEDLVVAPFRN